MITVRVASRVDLPLLPDVLGGQAPSFALDASHTVPIGQYQEVDRATAVTGRPRTSAASRPSSSSASPDVLAMVVALVVDTSAAYLQRQGLDTLADGAALHGADLGATGEDVYQGGVPAGDARAHARPRPSRRRRLPERDRRLRPLPGTLLHGPRRAATGCEVHLTAPLDLPLSIPGSPERATIGADGSAVVGVDD